MTTALAVAEARVNRVTGLWQRHVGLRWRADALKGRPGYGRWGTETGFPILYLGRPRDSVVIEAYRHLVDPVEDESIRRTIAPRVLVSAEVEVSDVLDLRTAGARFVVGLTLEQLGSDTGDRAAYAACQRIAEIAHQLGRHGVVTPAATDGGETLALFTDRLPAAERPRSFGEDELWERLPLDPREAPSRPGLRVVPPLP